MAAVLEKNDLSGRPMILPDGMANSEMVKCDDRFCQVSYTMAYGATEVRMQGAQKVLEVIREKAIKVIADSHSNRKRPV